MFLGQVRQVSGCRSREPLLMSARRRQPCKQLTFKTLLTPACTLNTHAEREALKPNPSTTAEGRRLLDPHIEQMSASAEKARSISEPFLSISRQNVWKFIGSLGIQGLHGAFIGDTRVAQGIH